MKAETFFEKFDRFAEAPDAVARIKALVLDLAVRGRLVAQNASDEPASELLKRVFKEKHRRKASSELSDQELVPTSNDEAFEIPENWKWVAATVPAVIVSDQGKKVQTKDILSAGKYPVVDQGKIFIRGYCDDTERVIRVVEPIVLFGDHTRETKLIDFDFVVGADGVKLLQPVSVDPHFYFLALRWLPLESRGYARHFKLLKAARIPLPPLAEQRRIVTKVDKLMALCDRLEAQQQERETLHAALSRASLGRFADAPTAANLQFLFHPSYAISPADLRKSILTLAVQGKLVAQAPSDEPAQKVLDRIAAKKLRLQEIGQIGKDKPVVAPFKSDSLPFEIPESWCWAKVANITELITKGSSPKWQGVSYVPESEGILFVTSENVGNYRLRKLDDLKYVERRFSEIEPRSILKNGDILLNLVGASIGRAALYDLHDGANINQAVALIRLVRDTEGVSPSFLLHYLNSPVAVDYMLSSRVVNAQPNISLTDAREFPVPIPPLAEQRRIVAKVDQLMVLVDQLEKQLAESTTKAEKLMEAIVAELTTQESIQQALVQT